MPVKKETSKKEETPSVVEQKANLSVYYEKSTTKNLGNFESVKITVGVSLPANPTKEDIKAVREAMETADTLVTEELEVQLKELRDK